MKISQAWSLCLLFTQISAVSITPNSTVKKTINLVVLDTLGHQAYNYHTLTTLATSVGFKVTYKNIYHLLQEPDLSKYDALIFMPSVSFMRAIKTESAGLCIKAVQKFGATGNKALGVLLPSPGYSETLKEISLILLTACGLFQGQPSALQKEIDTFLTTLLRADAQQGATYGTTLLNQKTDAPHKIAPLTFKIMTNPELNNHYFIGKFSDFSYADPEENFLKAPFDLALRDQLLSQAQQALFEFYQICTQDKKKTPKKLTLPKKLTYNFSLHEKKRAQKDLHQKEISCAWIGLDDLFAADYVPPTSLTDKQKEKNATNALTKGINFLYNAGHNILWIEFVPELYLSPHGLRKNQRELFIARTKILAAALRKKFSKGPLPKILIGTNLTSNFREHPVATPVTDLYGTIYNKIPAPLDVKNFWRPELLETIDAFITLFNKELPIDGVFLDFEMYHAQDQLAHYDDLMDFSDVAWNVYSKKHPTLSAIRTHKERIDYLCKEKLFDDYFSVLEKKAHSIGSLIRKHINKKIHRALIGGYAMTLPGSWFYRGIMRGLSTKNEPLLLATFNIDYYSHRQWLIKQKIYALHGAVLMLSKLKKSSDKTLIDRLKSLHDFIWYNKSSRMAYDLTPQEQEQQYWSLEVSPLPADDLAHILAQ